MWMGGGKRTQRESTVLRTDESQRVQIMKKAFSAMLCEAADAQ